MGVGSRPSSVAAALGRATLPRSSKAIVSRQNTRCGNASASHAPTRIAAIGTGIHSAGPSPSASR